MPSLFLYQSEDINLNASRLQDYETEFGVVQWFLETRLTSVLRKNWFNKPALYSPSSGATSSLITATTTSSGTIKEEAIEFEVDSKFKPEEIASLVNMGFTEVKVKIALKKFGSVDKALDGLLSGDVEDIPSSNQTPSSPLPSSSEASTKTSPIPSPLVELAKVQELVSMGFEEVVARKTLAKTRNNLDTAIEILVSGMNVDDLQGEGERPAKLLKSASGLAVSTSTSSSSGDKGKEDDSKRRGGKTFEENVVLLVAMGTTKEEATSVLEMFEGDLKQASELIQEQLEYKRGREDPFSTAPSAYNRNAGGKRKRGGFQRNNSNQNNKEVAREPR
jgi:Holliday junction resolvasome RuvABC DNA-binding subunit